MKQQEIDELKSAIGGIPPVWQMDPSTHYFVKSYGPNSVIGKEITRLMVEYEEKCAMAKIDMYAKIHTLLKQKHSKPSKPNKSL
jgi:hypothetical protein